MKRNGIEYPEPANQGSRKEQIDASAKAIIIITIMFIVLAFGAYLWNKFGPNILKFFI